MPHSSIDTEAGWTRRSRHGWVHGWKLYLVVTVAAVWVPLAADVTLATVAGNVRAPALLPALPRALRFLLADTAYDDPALRAAGDRPATRHPAGATYLSTELEYLLLMSS